MRKFLNDIIRDILINYLLGLMNYPKDISWLVNLASDPTVLCIFLVVALYGGLLFWIYKIASTN